MSKIWIALATGALAWFLFTTGSVWWGIGVVVFGVLLLIGKHEEDKKTAYERSYLKDVKPQSPPMALRTPVPKPLPHEDFDHDKWLESLPKVSGAYDDPPKRKKSTSRKRKSKHAGEVIQIDYLDADYELTSREVRVASTTSQHIEGFCYLRNQTRTFRRDRIQGDILVMDTGELVNPFEY